MCSLPCTRQALQRVAKRPFLVLASAQEEFTALRGTWEPHGGSGKQTHGLQYIKLLVRKVVTIHRALELVVGGQRLLRGACSSAQPVLIWADEDVTFVAAPDPRLLGFAKSVDVAYVPFQAPVHHARFDPRYNFSLGMLDTMWVLESVSSSCATRISTTAQRRVCDHCRHTVWRGVE